MGGGKGVCVEIHVKWNILEYVGKCGIFWKLWNILVNVEDFGICWKINGRFWNILIRYVEYFGS